MRGETQMNKKLWRMVLWCSVSSLYLSYHSIAADETDENFTEADLNLIHQKIVLEQEESKKNTKKDLNEIALSSHVIPIDDTKGEQENALDDCLARMLEEGAATYKTGLSIDGGGIRGIIPALLASKIEEKEITNRPIHKIFDHIGGTSIGGILALGYTIPSKDNYDSYYSAKDLVGLFETNGTIIFPPTSRFNIYGRVVNWFRDICHPHYGVKGLETLLQSYFKDMKFRRAATNVLVTTMDSNNNHPFLFNSRLDDHRDYEVWKVARATSAAPTYFDACTHFSGRQLIDGGLYRNNPTALVLGDMYKRAIEQDEPISPANMLMLSLGTGQLPIKDGLPVRSGWMNAARAVIEAGMTVSSIGVDEQVRAILKPGHYLRINPKLGDPITLDEVSTPNFEKMKAAAELEYEKLEDLFKNGIFRRVLEKSDSK